MGRLAKHHAEHREWDLEQFGLPLLFRFANVRRPAQSWDAWLPRAVREHWEARGAALTDDNTADWLQDQVHGILGCLGDRTDDGGLAPLPPIVATVRFTAAMTMEPDERQIVRYHVTDRDAEQYFRWVVIEAVRQGWRECIKPCAQCGDWFKGRTARARFCSTPCRRSAETRGLSARDRQRLRRLKRAQAQRRRATATTPLA